MAMIFYYAGWLLAILGPALVLLHALAVGPRYYRERQLVDEMMSKLQLYHNPHPLHSRSWHEYHDWWTREREQAARAHNDQVQAEYREQIADLAKTSPRRILKLFAAD